MGVKFHSHFISNSIMTKRPIISINRDPQLSFLDDVDHHKPKPMNVPKLQKRIFEQPKPETIFIGQIGLEQHLKAC